jgi:hypothetical protein
MINDHGTHLFDEEAQKRFDLFVSMSGIKIFVSSKEIPSFNSIVYKSIQPSSSLLPLQFHRRSLISPPAQI